MKLRILDEQIAFFAKKSDLIAASNKSGVLLLALNANKLSFRSSSFWSSLTGSFQVIGYCDGIGANIRLCVFKNRIPGVELWLDVIEYSNHNEIFIVGGEEEVFEMAITKLKDSFPTKKFSGTHGYKSYDSIKQEITEFNPTLIIAALGSPKQELFLAKLKKETSLYFSAIGIGGSLDVFVGATKRAPKVLRLFGLEGIWRISIEPRKRAKGILNFISMWFTRIDKLSD
jgi:exopolysaccharide biosynthesis WecB/TagA/CpsF family protein